MGADVNGAKVVGCLQLVVIDYLPEEQNQEA